MFLLCLAYNGQGLLQGWNSLFVRPEPLLIKDIKVQANKQKANKVRPAQMKHNGDKMTIAPISSQPCSKPDVSSCFNAVLIAYDLGHCTADEFLNFTSQTRSSLSLLGICEL